MSGTHVGTTPGSMLGFVMARKIQMVSNFSSHVADRLLLHQYSIQTDLRRDIGKTTNPLGGLMAMSQKGGT